MLNWQTVTARTIDQGNSGCYGKKRKERQESAGFELIAVTGVIDSRHGRDNKVIFSWPSALSDNVSFSCGLGLK